MFTIAFTVWDADEILEVWTTYQEGNGDQINTSMSRIEGSLWAYSFSLGEDAQGLLTYGVHALDGRGSWNSTTIVEILIIDNDAPSVTIQSVTDELSAGVELSSQEPAQLRHVALHRLEREALQHPA